MKSTKEVFKNEPTKKFYQFLRELIDKELLTPKRIAEFLNIKTSNPHAYLYNLRTGVNGVTVEQIELAHLKLGLNPSRIFGRYEPIESEQAVFEEGNNDQLVATNIDEDVRLGNILKGILKEHNVNIDQYCKKRLGFSRQFLYQALAGKRRIDLQTALRVCQDHNVSMDVFREIPLSNTHYLKRIEDLEKQVYALERLVKMHEKREYYLQSKEKNLGSGGVD